MCPLARVQAHSMRWGCKRPSAPPASPPLAPPPAAPPPPAPRPPAPPPPSPPPLAPTHTAPIPADHYRSSLTYGRYLSP